MKLERILAGAAGAKATRRAVVIGAAMSGGALVVSCSPPGPADIANLGLAKPDYGAFGPFLRIDAEGVVTAIAKHIEFGQGTHTGLAALIAEELDADWSKIRVEDARADSKTYATAAMMGMQGTGGSSGMSSSFDVMRRAGAAARAMFVTAAAQNWNVPAGEITVKDGVVSHAASNRSAPFGELLEAASKVTPPAEPVLKAQQNFTLVGTERVRRLDSRAKVTGETRYTQDVKIDGMVTAVVAHPPRFGAKVKSFNDAETRKIAGVVDVVKIETGVAVLAENTWAALKGREALSVTWDESKCETRSSAEILDWYKKIARGEAETKWAVFDQKGDAAVFAQGAGETFTYDFPYLAHAAMEPMNCVAQVVGGKLKLTYGCQGPTFDQINVGLKTGTLPGSIEIETLAAGGSFGRRSTLTSDYVVEAALIAKKAKGRAVKLVWTREDDTLGGYYRPLGHHALDVRLGPDGFPAAWKHRIVIQSIIAGAPMPPPPFDFTSVEGAHGSPYLAATPVVDAQLASPKVNVPISWWRSVGATHTAMAMEHTIDQLAKKAGKDPVEYRRALFTKANAQRHLAVLNLAVEKAGWGAPIEAGWARGVAVHESFGSVVANVVEASIVDGEPRVRRVVLAIDCGTAVAPDQVRAQMEGSVCYGLSSALYGAITLEGGKVQQANFDSYRVLRMNEAPLVETHILPSANPPSGVGEPGTPAVIPALANALMTLTGKPTTSLPFVTA